VSLDGLLTVGAFIRDRADRYGERDLLVRGEQRLTYRAAERRSREMAKQLLSAGVTKSSRVGILHDNTPEWLVSWLAAARVGAVTVPMSTFYKPPELRRTLRHADVSLLLMASTIRGEDYEARLEDAIPELCGASGSGPHFLRAAPALRSVHVSDPTRRPWATTSPPAAEGVDDAFLDEVESEVVPSDPLVVVYTSGSTALPKGVVHAHAAVIRHAARIAERSGIELVEGDRILAPMPFFWIGGLVSALFTAMHVGAAIYCPPRFETTEVLELIERERISVFRGIPQVATAMANDPSYASRDLSSLRTPLVPRGPSRVHDSLGMTETCGPHTMGGRGVRMSDAEAGSFGWPVEGYEHKIVDPDTGIALGEGAEGEICVRGDDLMLGMVKRGRAEVFDPDGYYHTGDVGGFAGGLLYFTGRLGDMIKTGSRMNVTPREVEIVLESMPEVVTAVVVGVGDPIAGQDVAAAVVVSSGATLDEQAVLERAKRDLSAYKVPRRLVLLAPGELPMRDTGKVDRAAVARLFDRS
jgi:acyl-CoA synthetase (AMP-forming)/AMP-acid ligase II